jgi:uncharacterized protein (TIGR03663 family)
MGGPEDSSPTDRPRSPTETETETDTGGTTSRGDPSTPSTQSASPAGESATESTTLWERAEDALAVFGTVDTTRAILGITAVAVLVRLVGLGARPMHFDEARVAYWSLHYIESGSLAYRPVVHGPFIQLFNSWTFSVFGPSDILARLPVALAGGLLPATAFLFREHLRKDELVGFALFLSVSSILVYYSRFMRSDVLVAAFMFTAFGLFVRYYDTRRVGLLYAGVVFVGLGFASKENAIVYVLTWLGATALLVDHALYRPRRFKTGAAAVSSAVTDRRSAPLVARYAGHLLGLAVVLVAVLVFFYADRGAGMAGLQRPPTPPGEGATGLWEALGQPLTVPGYAADTLQSAANAALDHWGDPAGTNEGSLVGTYVTNIERDLEVLGWHGIFLLVFGLLGFVWERYGRSQSRNLVMFAGYCGLVSLLGYPLADDIGGAHWLHVHILVPMAIPAGVGIARFARFLTSSVDNRDTVATVLVAVVLVLIAGQVGATTVNSSFVDTTSTDNTLAQYAQPESEAREAIDAINAAVGDERPDVVVYSATEYDSRPLVSDRATLLTRPLCLGTGWYSSLPLPWYLEKVDADVTCQQNASSLNRTVTAHPPPLVITNADDPSVPGERLRTRYTARTFEWFQYDHRVTVWVREDRVSAAGWRAIGTVDKPLRASRP